MIALKEIYLNNFRRKDRLRLLKKYSKEYKKNKKLILKILKNTEYYHGTGAYEYIYRKDKYHSFEPSKVKFILRDVLVNGLKPSRDLFNDTFETGFKKSISLTKNRVYARTYSELFFQDGTDLKYAYGSSFFWNLGVFLRIVFGWIKRRNFKFIRDKKSKKESKIARKRFLIMIKSWSKSFRKDKKYENDIFVFLSGAKSDIKGNFGVVIGIKKNTVKPIKIDYPNISIDEARVGHVISSKDFTHLQVPLENLNFVEKELKKINSKVPLIPMEFVEMINSDIKRKDI